MIYIDRRGVDVPNVLLTEGIAETAVLCANYDGDNSYFSDKKSSEVFKRDVYAHSSVKELLIVVQNHKCCFCESRVTHISDGDVEHFRPKAAWLREVDGVAKLETPGYYFLAYAWDNLMLSCLMCNQRIKRNNFPLVNEEIRATVTHSYDYARETPIFINPLLEDPELHIDFYEDMPRGITARGRKTIEYLGLDRHSLNEARKERFKDLYALKECIDSAPDNESRERAAHFLRKRIAETIEKNGQYIGMIKANFTDFLE